MRTAAIPFLLTSLAFAQFPGLTLPPSGGNQKASITQFIGAVRVSIDYSSPKVHGPYGPTGATTDRRGKIWGDLVPYGLTDPGFGTSKQAPWRMGANENTVFTVSHPVRIEGKSLPAGAYGLHAIVNKDEWTLIFSKNSTSWGSFFYDPKEDALRVNVKPQKHDYREYLTFEFPTRDESKAVAEMQWEDLKIAFTIEPEQPGEVYISNLQQQLRSSPGFTWLAWVQASQYLLQSKQRLDLALEWADAAITRPFVGQKNFNTLSNKAQILAATGKATEAKDLLLEAVNHPSAQPGPVHQLGRQLQATGKNQEALEIFKANFERHAGAWPTHVGMARGYMGIGDKAKALEHARKALAQAPDEVNRKGLTAMVEQLSKN